MMTSPAGGPSLRQRLRRPPWRWVVVVASFFVYTVLFGIVYSYNVLLIVLKEEFNSSVTVTGWIGSVSIGLTLLLAPLVNVLIERFGCRTVAVFGIASAAGAILVTSFLSDVISVFIVYGVGLGVGGGLVTVCAYDIILLYFPEKNSVRAMALLLSGTSFGMLSFTPLMSFIISRHGWRILLRILGPLLFSVGLPCVLTYVEPSNIGDGNRGNQQQKIINQRHQKEPSEITALTEDSTMPVCHFQKPFVSMNDESQNFQSEDGRYCQHIPVRTTAKSKKFHQLKDLNANADRGSCANKLADDPTESRDPDMNGEVRCEDKTRCVKTNSGISMTEKILISLTFPELWLISISAVLNGIGDCFYFVNLINYMISVGFPEQTGVKVASALGFSNLVGKVSMSLAGEYIPFPRVFLLVISSVVSIGVMLVIMFTRNQIAMYCVAVVVGGVTMTITNTITFSLPSEFFGPERALETSAVILFTYGIGFVLGSVVGQSIDTTGSYTSALWAFIGMYAVSGLFVVMAPVYQRFFARHRFVTFDLYRKKMEDRKKSATSATKTTDCKNNLKSTHIVFERVTCL